MKRFIAAGVVVAASLLIGAHRRHADALPFYRSAERTPEWIAAGSAEYAGMHRVSPFDLTDQDGHQITRDSVKGKIYVASFFFTECRQLCPKLQVNLARIQQAFARDADVLLLSHSVTPEHDDTARLQRYARANGVMKGKWHLLTGSVSQISSLARNSYFAQLPDSVNGVALTLLHSETLVLVDRSQRVRGVYDGSLMYDVERLIADIHALK